jgi:hypothetical protein
MKALAWDRWYDNVLLGQGYRTLRGAVIQWSNSEMMISRGKPKDSEKNLLQCNFVHHESRLKSPGNEPGLYGEKTVSGHLSYSTTPLFLKIYCVNTWTMPSVILRLFPLPWFS